MPNTPHITEQALVQLEPKNSTTVGVLGFHGRNRDPEEMHQLLHDLGLDQTMYSLPRATNQSWYPDGFMAPLSHNQGQLNFALESAKTHHQQLNDAGIDDGELILLGFSQGACLAAQYALQNPRKYKAIFILTGGYIGPENWDWKFKGDFHQTPVYITTSKIDEWVPASRAKETAEVFQQMNANVLYRLFEDRPHIISEEEKEDIQSLLKKSS